MSVVSTGSSCNMGLPHVSYRNMSCLEQLYLFTVILMSRGDSFSSFNKLRKVPQLFRHMFCHLIPYSSLELQQAHDKRIIFTSAIVFK